MNYMEQVAEMLGVELNDEFKLLDLDYKVIGKCRITPEGLEFFSFCKKDWIPDIGLELKRLLNGERRVGDIIYQPKDDEDIRKARARYKAGIVCRTEKEALGLGNAILEFRRQHND